MQCQKTYLAEGHCKNETFGASKWCRWHKIIEEFRADLSRIPRIAAQGMMFGSSIWAYGVAYCLWMFAKQNALVWPMLAIFLCGGTAKYFADGCIAQDHPFAQFALWGKLLAFGLFVEITSGATLGYYLLPHSSESMAVVRQFTTAPFWTKYGPPLLTVAIIIETGFSARLLVRRVLFFRKPGLNSLITVAMLVMTGAALRPIWWAPSEQTARSEHPTSAGSDFGRAASARVPEKEARDSEVEKRRVDQFWQPAIGESYTALIGVYVLGFILAELINKRMRSRDEGLAVFRATVWPSFPVCFGSPFLGALGSRFLMVWTETQDPWVFGAVAVSIAGLATVLGTKLVIRNHLASLRRHGESPGARRERRQELMLFLRGASSAEGGGYLTGPLAQTVREIEFALEYSAAGLVESYRKDGDFLIVQMAGASADRIFGALQDLLEGTSIQPGSFAVMRYGGAGEERLIEL